MFHGEHKGLCYIEIHAKKAIMLKHLQVKLFCHSVQIVIFFYIADEDCAYWLQQVHV